MIRNSKLCVFLAFTTLISTVASQGQSCSSPTDCDPDGDRFTDCNSEGQCGCADATDSIFLSTTQTCYKQAGKSCISVTPVKKCVPNSLCVSTECKCNAGLEANVDGLCYIPHGKDCDSQRDLCDPSAFLYCGLQMKCECNNAGNSTYDGYCRILVGEECAADLECVQGASCVSDKCKCDDTHEETESRECSERLADHGEKCDTILCDATKYLECDGNICKCKEDIPGQTFFDSITKRCYLLENSECSPDGQLCAPNSECLNGNCKCNLGLKPNDECRCFLPLGDICDIQNDLCDPVSFLACGREGRCNCSNPANTTLESRDSSKTCRLLVNSVCDPDVINFPNLQKCVENSNCDLDSDGIFRCKCTDNFYQTEEKICKEKRLEYGQTCGSSSIIDLCDESLFLACNATDQCDCKIPPVGGAIFDEETDTCYLLHTSDCDPEGQLCAPNSECIPKNGKNICLCKGDMEPNRLGLCFISYDHKCKTNNDLCDPFEYLECGNEDKCSCKSLANSIFEEKDGKCHLLVDSKCTIDGQNCVSNAVCDATSNKCLCENKFHPNDSRICARDVSSFGERCSPGTDDVCDSEKLLHCNGQTGLCDCIHENSWYNIETQMCYYLAEADCKVNMHQHCVPNSFCNNDGICQCNDGLFPNDDKFCHVDYHKKCNHTSHRDLCDPLQFLECGLQGLCDCHDFENTWYNSTSRMCEVLANGKCSTIAPSQGKYQPCIAKSICNDNGICECEENFKANSTNFCTLGHGKSCLEKSYGKVFCNPENYLECRRNGRCGCQNDQFSYYDDKTDYCFLTEGAPCALEEQKCGPNSKCMQRHGEKEFTCTCTDGLIPNENRLCFLPYNSSCSAGLDLCDPDGFLNCGLHNKCECKSKLSYYNLDAKKCQSLAKSECSLDDRQKCVENAMCLITPSGTGKCKCLGNFTIDNDGHCRLLHGVPCSKNENLCDSKKFLTCGEYGQCTCQNNQAAYYDDKTQYCYLLAGKQCNNSENSQKCIQNSHCDTFSHTCRCNTEPWPLEENGLGHCALTYSKNCSVDNDLCDKSGFLQCDSENHCGCKHPGNTWYNSATHSCELKAGVSCTFSNSSQACHPNSECKPIGGGGSNENICVCAENLTANANDLCHLKHGQICELDNKDLCDPDAFLSCEPPSKKCDCNLPNSVFNEISQKCERLPGGACFTDENEPMCVANSYCSKETKTCTCDDGFEFSKSTNSCRKSHGLPCNSTIECNGESHLSCIGQQCVCNDGYFVYEEEDSSAARCLPGYQQPCNEEFPCIFESELICTADSICQCPRPHEQIFESEIRKCVGVYGSQCEFENTETGNVTNANCISNADCVFSFNGTATAIGVCLCEDGYKPDDSKQCISGASIGAFTPQFTIITGLITLIVIII